ncbi:MAG: bile acid:sodium symporter family protein [Myxococcales bacterium]|nr:bile acid:sodium symporter family protein [Myxococcales bacterium]MDH3484347.1 bile acid:sodium symporter family protein [Myxococcales bacterium]
MSAIVRLFPLWVTVAGVAALVYPPAFTWFLDYGLITPGLQIIMLGMGVTLELSDFARVARTPAPILWGVLLQYTVMPLVGWSSGYLFSLPTPFAVGLILVCCCPGGTASNVIAYLAKADVALSVSMTAFSTMLAAACTPLLTTWLVGSRVDVDARGLLVSTAEVVLLPVVIGLVLRRYLPKVTARILPLAPVAAVVMIVLIVAAILGDQKDAVLESGSRLLAAVVTAHAVGFLLGYVLGSRTGGFGNAARTISIEVGMQNSGLGAVLAQAHFANPLTAIPSALSAITHCILGSAAAAWWSRRPPKEVSLKFGR